MTNLVWFKSDLRVCDNPALSASMARGDTLAVYVLCPKQWQKHGISLAKQSLILRQLISLRESLDSLNVPLVVLQGSCFKDLPKQLIDLCNAFKLRHLFWNREYEFNERRCEEELSLACENQGIIVRAFDDSVLFPPGSVKKPDGSQYKVFTAFKKSLYKNSFQGMRALCVRPSVQIPFPFADEIKGISDEELLEQEKALSLDTNYSIDVAKRWPSGEDSVHSCLEIFIKEKSHSYHKDRDFPEENVTSLLSPYLAIGAISTRQCIQEAFNQNGTLSDDSASGLSTWINELVWREFYRHILASNQSLCRFKAYKSETDTLPWKHDRQMFEAWKNGMTGFPIVDAAMRQLKQTGWMHNRLRMVVAMFLTKHLFIDWRWGEAYFMSKLIDGDFASNNGGWQWSASTGVDAVPYFRIFNPTRQSMRFDPEGEFIRRYLPELSHLSSKDIHQPSAAQALEANYVLPIVEHKQATEQTKIYFSQLNSSKESSLTLNQGMAIGNA